MRANEIKNNRSRKGLTQLEAAIKIGVSIFTYRLWENGGSKPNGENLKKLRAVLGGGAKNASNGEKDS